MIRLTPYEQRMLDGEFGAAKQVSLQKIIDYAQILGAEELVPITKAHLCCGSTCEPSDFPDGNLDRPDILAMGYHDWQTKLKCPDLAPADFNSFNESTYVMDDVHCCDTLHLRSLSGRLAAGDGRVFRHHRIQQCALLQLHSGRPRLRRRRQHHVLRRHLRPRSQVGPAPARKPPRHSRIPRGLRHRGQDRLGSAGRRRGPPFGPQCRPRHLRRFPAARPDQAEDVLHRSGRDQRL